MTKVYTTLSIQFVLLTFTTCTAAVYQQKKQPLMQVIAYLADKKCSKRVLW